MSETEEFTVDSEPTQKHREAALKVAEEEIENTEEGDKELNLEKDPITIEDQEYALVCFVAPELAQKTKIMGMKIKGVFGTLKEAQTRAKELMKMDDTFDIYVMQMYHWCAIPPSPELIKNQEYLDEKLNTLIKEYKKQKVYAREVFNHRKDDLMGNIKRIDDKLKKENEERQKNEELESLQENVETVVEEIVTDTLEKVFDDANESAGELMRSMSTCVEK